MRSDRPISGFAPLPLRVFLGITFIYAALQKLTDPGFFKAGSPTYIGAQIEAFSRGSPIQGILHHLMEHAVAVGLLTVVTEGTIGILVALGLLTRPAALVGMALSFGFFLTASWQTYPYFFGSDIVFVVCWLTLAITGPGVYALDSLVEAPLRRAWHARFPHPVHGLAFNLLTGMHGEHADAELPEEAAPVVVVPARPVGRRLLTRGEALVASGVAIALIALGLHPRASSSAQSSTQLMGGSSAPPTPAGTSPAAAPTAGTAPTAATPPGIPAGAKRVGNISQLPVNSAGTVTDPKTGDPAIIVRTSSTTTYAYDALCTHAGCTVQYDPQQKYLVCPCHGGTFDPAHGAQVVAGPPPSPLAPLEMKIDAQGNIYLV